MSKKNENVELILTRLKSLSSTVRKDKRKLYAIALTSIFMILMLASLAGAAPYAYITNSGSDTVSVVDTETDTVTATVDVGSYPEGVAVSPDGAKVYVVNQLSNSISVIDTTDNTVTATVPVGSTPEGVAVTPDGKKVYVANVDSNTISVIDTTTNTITDTVNTVHPPLGVAVNPDGTKVYVTTIGPSTIYVIDTATNTITADVGVGAGPNGVAVNPTGTKVYVANSGSNDVSVIDTSSNTVTATVAVGTVPCEVAVTPDGTRIYVANMNSSDVSVIDTATNTVITTVNVGSSPKGIAVNTDGTKVYVANKDSNTVSVIDTATNTVTTTIDVGTSPTAFGQFIFSYSPLVIPVANFSSNITSGYVPLSVQFTDNSENATGWNWDFGDGNTSTDQNPMHIYSAAGNYTVNLTASNLNGTNSTFANITVSEPVLPYNFVKKWGSFGSSNGSFNSPQGVAVDSLGNVYVADRSNHRIQKFDSSGNFITTWGSSGSGDGQFSYPHGISIDSSGDVYVADELNSRIQKFDSSGNFITTWGSYGSGNGQFSYPNDVTIDSSGNIYVADAYNDRIQKFDSSGNFITKWGSSGNGNGQFTFPVGVAVDSLGNVYVVDCNNHRIQKFDNSGTFITKWGFEGTENGNFTFPRDVAVDSSDNVYVVDSNNHRIQKFDSAGGFLTKWGSVGSSNGQLSSPFSVAVNSSGNIVYVVDMGNNRIQKFSNLVLPVANFNSNVTGGYYPLSVQFIDSSTNATEWSWNFGDGNTSIEQNPMHTYSVAGNYTVNLTASNGNGTDSKFATITVSEPPVLPVAGFSSNVISGYAPLSVQFTDSSENATGWNWNFGDGNTSTEQNPTHIYSSVSNYAVNLTVSNENGTNSAFTDITVLEQPVAYQSIAYISNSASNTVSVIDTTDNTVKATVNVENNPWGVAATLDGKVYVANDQSHTVSVIDIATNTVTSTVPVGSYPFGVAANLNGTKVYVTNQGSYNVSVIDTSTNTVTASVDIESIPAGIAVNPAGTKVYVTQENGNVSVIDTANNTIIANVSVGNIPTGITVSPTGRKAYVTSQDTVSVIDTATNTVIATVNVGIGPAGVTVSPDGTKVYVTNMGSGNVSVIDTASNTVTASVGVGNSPFGVSFTLDGTKAYVANMGSDTVSVIDTANNTATATVNVGNSPVAFGQFIGPELVLPVANFSTNVTSGYIPLSVQFNDSSEDTSGWIWDFGDGFNSTAQNPTHTYSIAGNYTVNFTASNGNGTNSTFATITVSEQPVLPVANFSANASSGYVPLSIQFTDFSENVTEWNWDFGDGNTSTEQNPVHTYSTVGNYTVNLTASNGNGTNSTFANITVLEQSVLVGQYAYITNAGSNTVSVINTTTNTVTATVPVGDFPWGIAVNPAGTKVYVTNQDSNNVSVIDTATNTVMATVDVGSYPFGIAVNPAGTKVYVANHDSNTVSVIGTATNTVTATLNVGNFPRGVAVNPAGTKVYVVNRNSNTVSVIDTATNTVTATVPVGDYPEGVAITPDGTKVYVTNSGSTNVSVVDTANNTVAATVDVGDLPRGVAINPAGTKVYVANQNSNNVSVIDTATDTVTSTVNVGNNPYGVAINPEGTKVYVANIVSNTVSVIDTSIDTVTATVSVGTSPIAFGQFVVGESLTPVANFSSNVSSGYAPLSVQFNDSSLNATSILWDFGDGNTSTDQNPVHTFSVAGNYTVNLTASNGNGTDSKLATITVSEPPVFPVASFSSNVTSGYAPLSVQFTDMSENATGWNWDFGDGNTSIDQNPVHTYSLSGNYTVNLTAGNGNGTNSTFATITVSEPPVLPVAGFSSNVISGYAPLSVQFTDSSENATGWNWNFGDGNTSTEQNPMHTYSTAGNYTVNLTASNVNGNNSKTEVITVLEDSVLIGKYAYIPNYDNNNVSVIDTDTNTVIGSISVGSGPYGIVVSPDGSKVYVADRQASTVSVINTTTNTVMANVNVGSGPKGIAISPDGTKVYVTDWLDKKVHVIDTASNTVIASVTVGSQPNGVAVNPSGTKVYVANFADQTVSVINTTTNTVTATINVGSGPNGIVFNPAGTIVYVTNRYDNAVSVINTATNTITATISVGSSPYGIAINPAGTKLYVTNYGNNNVSVINTSTNTVISTVNVGSSPYGVAVTPDGTRVYVANSGSNNVSIIDTLNNTVTATVPVGRNPVSFGQFMGLIPLQPVFPEADFSSNVTSGYIPLSVQFNDSSENADELNWDFGDGNTSIDQNPVHTYSTVGNYTVNLTASNGNGTNSTFANITVLEQPVLPVANFSSNVSSGFVPLSIQFNDSSLNATGILWDFGDGNTSTEQNPIHTYSTVGNYTVNLTVSNANGTNSAFANITVLEYNPAYTIDKTVTDVTGKGASANVTVAGDVISYQISVNNTGNIDLTNVNISDPLLGNLTGPTGDDSQTGILNVGENWTYTGTYTVTQTDLNSNGDGDGFINNTATVDCDELNELNDSAEVPVEQNPACTIDKIVTDVSGNGSSANVTQAGDVISYQINLTNDGNLDLTNVNVSDPLLGNLAGPSGDDSQAGILNVGENWTYTGIYNVTQSDINSNGGGDGFINNTATVDCDELNELNDSAEVPVEQNPAYSIDKTVTDVSGNGASANVTVTGDVISYQVNVTNDGNINLTNISVIDSLINLTEPTESVTADDILEVGETWSCTGTYTVTQADMNSNGDGDGFINNTATVDCDELDPENDTTETPIEQSPAYSIDKTVTDVSGNGSSANVTQSGDVISYQVNVTNDGNIDLTNVIVSDPLINLTAPSESLTFDEILNVGENWTYTGTYTVTQSDLNSNGDGDGFFNNTATVDCTELDSESDSVEVPIEQSPAYSIDKTVIDVSGNGALANVTQAGDVISYQVNVTNDGNIDLTNVGITDPLLGNLTGPAESGNADGILEAGEYWTYTGTYTVTQSDINSNGGGDGFINNTASVDCIELDPENDSIAVPIVQNSAYTIEKTVTDVSGNGASANVTIAGDVVSYQISVNNTGNIDLTNVNISDPLLGSLIGPSGDDSSPGVLNVGENWTYTGTYTITQADLNSNGGGDGFINNTASVDCTELDLQNDSAEVPVEQNPAYTIEKTVTDVSGNGASANVTVAGDVISYQISVNNTGNIDLTNVNISDPLLGNLTGPIGDDSQTGILNVGENWTYTGTYTVTQADLNSDGDGDGFINNTISIDCDQLGPKNDSVEVPIEQSPAYTIDKTVINVSGNGVLANVTQAGDVISYQINVSNTGNIDLTNVSVDDPLLVNLTGPSGDNSQSGVLNVGENWTYHGNYTVTQEDLNDNGGGDGFINNTVSIDCTELDPENDSVAVPVEQNPAYTIGKTVVDVSGNGSGANVTKAGDVISYQVNVTNDGNIDLTNVGITDPLINLTEPTESLIADDILEVGETWAYTGTYNVTQTDLNSNGGGDGFINNTATVDCDELDPENDSSDVQITRDPAYSIEKIVTDVDGEGSEGNVNSSGDVINYQINVNNTGNIDLINVNVTDPLLGNLAGPVESLNADEVLEVGENWTYTGTYTVTQADLNSDGDGDGFINNTATVDCDELNELNDSAEVPVEQNPAYSIDKIVTDVSGNGASANVTVAGDVISYQINVNNTGNLDLINVSVSDPLLGNLTGPSGDDSQSEVLNVGENWTYTGTYTVAQADLNSDGDGDGFINNTATVDCDELDPENDSAESPIEQNPVYSIDKTVTDVSGNGSSANVTVAGDIISYQINVTNDGNIDLTNVNVSDPLLGNLTGPTGDDSQTGILNVGENWTYIGTYIVTQADLNSNGDGDGFINNTASVDCDEMDLQNDSIEVPIEQKPACDVNKMVIDVAGNGPEGNISSAGDIVQFQVNVTNTGNVDLTNINVTDSLINLTGPYEDTNQFQFAQSIQIFQALQNADGVLGVGETWIYLGNYTVTQEDLNNNGDGDGFLNSTVTFDSDQTEPINDTTIQYGNESGNETGNETGNESEGVRINRNPAYSFYKSVIEVDNGGDCIVDDAGDIIRYRIVVKNEGNVDLTNVSVNDILTSLSGPAGDDVDSGVLNVGEIWKFYGNYTVTQEDLNNNGGGDGDIDNTATVSCDELPNKIASISQPISQDAYLRIYKSAIGVDNAGDNIANEAGDIIEYQIAVKNAGKVDLTGVSVNDPMISLTDPVEYKSADEVLTVGELWVYTGNYTLTQDDLNTSGGGDEDIDNTATVSCNELPNATSSIEVPIVVTRTVAEGTDSESDNTTDDTDNTTEDNSSSDDNNSDDNSDSDSSSGSSSHSSSGGSGGASVSPESSKNIEVKEISQAFVTSGNSVKFSFPKNVTSITSITFDAKKTAGKTTTIVEMLKGKSALTSSTPAGEVYKYLNIWVGNSGFATSKNIENAVIGFKVEKSWMQNKGTDSSSIVLNRYSDDKWSELPTSLSGEDDRYLYFSAKSPGFSPFAITAKVAGESGTEVQPESNAKNTEEGAENEAVDEPQATNEGNASKSENTPGFEVIYGIAGLLAVFLYKRK